MENLRLLQINDARLTGSYDHLSKELKWLCWHKCSLKFLPQNFHLENLVILDMQHSNVEQVWEKNKIIFNKLKVLNLSNSKSLTRSPDFSQVPNLEILILEGCTNLKDLPNFLQTPHLKSLNLEGCTSLVEIHESIGLQKGLVLLNLRGCENLRNLPKSIYNLKSLQTLVLSTCFNLAKLPKQLGHMTALTELYMEYTNIKQLPSTFRFLRNLKILSFRGCECLIESPQFSQSSCLKEVTFEGCTSLIKIHESIGHLKRLKSLNLKGCNKLRNLPSNISNLESLKLLMLSDCAKLEKLPEQWENMKALWELIANGTDIKQLPSSLGLLSNLRILTLPGCGRSISPKSFNHMSLFSVFELCSLIELDLSDRNLSEDEFPIGFECLSLLKKLKLSRNNFRYLPSCIIRLPILESLELNECTTLQSISLPRSVSSLEAYGCTSLERISILTSESSGSSHLETDDNIVEEFSLLRKCSALFLHNCHKLVEIQSLESLWLVHMGNCNNLSSDFRKSVLQMMCKTDEFFTVLLPGSEIPNWISHQTNGCSISFRVPDGKIDKVLFCIVYAVNKEAPRDILAQGVRFAWRLCNKSYRNRSLIWCPLPDMETPDFDTYGDHILAQMRSDPLRRLNGLKMESGDKNYEMEVGIDLQMGVRTRIGRYKMFEIDPQIMEVKRCGVHLLVDEHDPNVTDDEISESED